MATLCLSRLVQFRPISCKSLICVLLLTDGWRGEGQSAVGAGPHLHSFRKENVEEVDGPAPHRHRVSPQLILKMKTLRCWL